MMWHQLAPWRVLEQEPLRQISHYLAEPEVQDQLRKMDEAREYPQAIRKELHQLGLARVFTGRGHEAGGPSFVQMSGLAALTAYSSESLAITVGVNGLALLPLYHEASEDQLNRVFDRVDAGAYCSLLLTERGHGSNLLRNRTSAKSGSWSQETGFVEGGQPATHYQVNGEKHLINGGTFHELLFTFVRSGGDSAANVGGFGARNDFTMLLIERDETVSALPRWETLPAPAADISGVRFVKTLAPVANRIGQEGSGFSLVQKTLMISRGGIGALASGSASRALALTELYADERNIYGEPISRLGAIAEGLLRMKALDVLIASMSLKATAMTNACGVGAAHYTSTAKYACCLLAEELVTEGRMVHGGAALLTECPYQSMVRDILLYGIFDGTSHLMLDQLQWRLAQTSALPISTTPPIEQLKALFTQSPNNLVQILRERQGTILIPTVDYLRDLDRIAGQDSLQPLIVVCEALFAFTRECRKLKMWDGDQALRFAAGHAFALIETLISLVEFCDPSRRSALGMPAVVGAPDDFAQLYRFAFGWMGLKAAAAVRTARAQAGISAPSQLEVAESMFTPIYADARRALLARAT